jgi:hypothetical protein
MAVAICTTFAGAGRKRKPGIEPHDFAVLDVENLRLPYAKTGACWLARYEEAVERVARMFDERFVRAWRLHLAGTIAASSASVLQLFQVTFARGRSNDMPWTRARLYGSTDDGRRPESLRAGRP